MNFDIPEITENEKFVNCIVEFFEQHPDVHPTEENIFKNFSVFEPSLTPEVLDKVIQRPQPEAKDEKLVKWSDLLMGKFWRSTIGNWAN